MQLPSALPDRGPDPVVLHAVCLSQRDPIQSAKTYPNAQSIGIFVEPPHDDTSELSRLRRSAVYAAGACQIFVRAQSVSENLHAAGAALLCTPSGPLRLHQR